MENLFTSQFFRFRPVGRDIGEFRQKPVKFEFGAKILKPDFDSLDGSKQSKSGREVHSRLKTHHRMSLGLIDLRISEICH